ncbi:MAG: putative acyl-CoA dehydrogenase [Oleiphilaceae bacterium]|jgi:putative acyl-CoA dehydrogenase
MTLTAILTLKRQANLFKEWAPKILHNSNDSRNIPHTSKESVTIGMAMTEKQGGSDVRSNSTRTLPLGKPGLGQSY